MASGCRLSAMARTLGIQRRTSWLFVKGIEFSLAAPRTAMEAYIVCLSFFHSAPLSRYRTVLQPLHLRRSRYNVSQPRLHEYLLFVRVHAVLRKQ